MVGETEIFPLIRTKLQRPRLPGDLIPRRRLVDRLHAGSERKLTLISAMAGTGKTTLLAQWLEECPQPSAWLSLDEHDNDRNVFLTYLCAAIRGVFPHACERVLDFARALQPPPARVIIASIINELDELFAPPPQAGGHSTSGGQPPTGLILALDDYHRITEPAIQEILSSLIERLPQGLHLALATRADPQLPLAGWRARWEMTEVRSADLRFTSEEAHAILEATTGRALMPETTRLLEDRTEGWVVGLRLAALSMRTRSDARAFVQAFKGTSSDLIVEYLVSEVLARQSPEIQNFALRTSVLNRFSAPLCQAVTGVSATKSQEFLEWIARANLFLVPLDAGGGWYRYHHLFRDLLRHRLGEQSSAAGISELHARAGTWFAQNGLIDEALHHFLTADDAPAAEALVAGHRYALMNRAQWPRLERYLQQFSPEFVDQSPDLLMMKTWLLYQRGRYAELPAAVQKVEAVLAPTTLAPEAIDLLQGEICALRSFVSTLGPDVKGAISHARCALAKTPYELWIVRILARMCMASALLMRGDVNGAFEAVYAGFEEEGDQSNEFKAALLTTACNIHWMTADLPGLAQAAEQILALSLEPYSPAFRAWGHYHLGPVRYHHGDLAAAAEHFAAVVRRPYLSYGTCYVNSACGLALTHQALGRPEQAREVVETAIALMLETGNTTLLPVALAFPGVIGRMLDESSPAWPEPNRAKEGAPNVIFFVLDDVGYGQLSPFGGLVNVPTLGKLAQHGLRYTNFHTTALCSPTRGCVLTGRNHHTLGLSAITEISIGYPAHNGCMGFEHGFISETLLEHGYNTFAVGKWHLAPPEETTTAGPFHRWPLGRGFERYYGFLGGDTDQWFPDLTYDNHPVPVPKSPEEGYHLNIDLADKAIEFIQDAYVNAPDKPFFLYYATGAGHAPHHVEPEWIEKYKGKFDMGWDEYRKIVFERQKEMGILPAGAELSAHDPDVPEWDSLPADAKKMYARQMEVYAAFLEQTDYHFGRIIEFLEKIGELENTIVVAISDNGASCEGGVNGTFNEALFFNNVEETLEDNLKHYDEWGSPNTFNHYSWGWTWAGDTPFRRWKRETYRGGVSDACLVFWPEGIEDSNEIRTQYAHAVDLVPTILEALGIEAPEMIRGVPQSPIQGTSFAHSFDNASAETKHHTQYFEMFAHRSIYHDGWKAVCPFPGPSFSEAAQKERYFGMPLTAELLNDLDAHGWELYNVVDDPAETKNLAAEMPDKVQEMAQRWYAEAGKYGALPLASAELARMNVPRPTVSRPRKQYTYYSGGAPISFSATPKLYNRPHSITADVVIPDEGAEGMLMTHGSRNAGYALFVKDGHLHYIHNYVGLGKFEVISSEPVPTGEVSLRYEFEPTGEPRFREGKGSPGRFQLYFNNKLVGNLEVPYSTPQIFGVLGASCGYAAFDSVNPEVYEAPFRFSGEIKQVVIDVSGEVIKDDEAELKRLMTQQ